MTDTIREPLPEVKNTPVLYMKDVIINSTRGDLYLTKYGDGQLALAIGSEVEGWLEPISINLIDYGIIATEGDVIIPDYSEHTGTLAALNTYGAVDQVVHGLTFGPYNTKAYEIVLKRI